jgi:hypothetical protein
MFFKANHFSKLHSSPTTRSDLWGDSKQPFLPLGMVSPWAAPLHSSWALRTSFYLISHSFTDQSHSANYGLCSQGHRLGSSNDILEFGEHLEKLAALHILSEREEDTRRSVI